MNAKEVDDYDEDIIQTKWKQNTSVCAGKQYSVITGLSSWAIMRMALLSSWALF